MTVNFADNPTPQTLKILTKLWGKIWLTKII
jgi:hypothetical protein